MERLRGTSYVEEEIEEMRVEGRKSMGVTNFTLKQLVTSPSLRLSVVIACVLQTTQQWSGINAVMSYSAFIFAQANVPDSAIPYVIVGTGTINVLATIVAVPLMEKAGRRPLLLWPMGMMCISFLTMTIFLNLMGNPSLESHSSAFAIVCIVVAHTYIVGFALGLGPIPFIVVSEIFRQEPRAAAMSLSLVFNWMGNFILSLIFPFMKDGLQEYTYIVFSVILAAAIVFIFFLVPETKSKTFDQIANTISVRRRSGARNGSTGAGEAIPMSDQ
ncbi:solute carrier family 2, facilitated glucose transporter member 3-like [Babylonia areolata]